MGQQRLDTLRIGDGARYTGTIRTTASVYDGKIPASTLVDAHQL